MNIHQLKPKTKRQSPKRVGRGGKKGTFSGKGSKGQKARAGAYVRPGFRGGDNRLWQLFPKQRGAGKKPGNSRPHPKHKFFILRGVKPTVLNLEFFESFKDGQTVSPQTLMEGGKLDMVSKKGVKILGDGTFTKKITFEGFIFSASAKEKIASAGSTIK